MDQILNQIGGLVLGAVPTMVLFILTVVFYGLLVRRPLDHILAERHARTAGAVEKAKGAISEAEARTAEYEERLRKARAEIFAGREAKLKQWAAEREQALSAARTTTTQRVLAGKLEIEQSLAAAQRQIEAASAELSEQVLRAVLPEAAL
ncbi:MAG TPA: ATP synthase F0 subunit B [Acidobacteriaceae bacterium]|nr:ATP synthase F0 subunit B [Acidobacteriaceae bacterium]